MNEPDTATCVTSSFFEANLLSAGRCKLTCKGDREKKIVLSIHKGFLKQTGFLHLLLGNSIQQLHTTSQVNAKNLINFFVIMTCCYYGGRLEMCSLAQKIPDKELQYPAAKPGNSLCHSAAFVHHAVVISFNSLGFKDTTSLKR